MNDWNAQIIAEFRANGGKAAEFGDAPLVILHTIGAKSGELRETPLVALVEGDDLYVFASKGGAPTNPDWYYNLKAQPEITVEYGTETFTADRHRTPRGRRPSEAASPGRTDAAVRRVHHLGRASDHPCIPPLTCRLTRGRPKSGPRPRDMACKGERVTDHFDRT